MKSGTSARADRAPDSSSGAGRGLVRARLAAALACLAALAVPAALSSACAPRPIAIGFIGGLTGGQSELGVSGRNGAQLRIEEANARGELRGRRVELVPEDDANSPGGFGAAVDELLARKVRVVIGPYTSGIAELAAAERRLFFLSPTASADSLSRRDDTFFRLMGSSMGGSRALAEKAVSALGARTAAIVYDSANGLYSEDFIAAFESAFAAKGGRVVATESYSSSSGTARFAPILDRLLASRPAALLVIATGSDTALLIRRAKQLSPGILTLASGWAATTDFLKYGGQAMSGTLFEQQFDPSSRSPAYLDFVAAYQARFGSMPSFSSMYSYEAVGVLLSALAGGASSPEEVKRALLANPEVHGLQADYAFDAFGDVARGNPLFIVHGESYDALK